MRPGPNAPSPSGTRVAVDPTIACAARGLDPCPQCVVGHFSTCLRIGEGIFTPGMSHGFTVDLGSGWSDQLVAHMSQLHVAPDAVPTLAIPLAEPLSIVLHGFLHRFPLTSLREAIETARARDRGAIKVQLQPAT